MTSTNSAVARSAATVPVETPLKRLLRCGHCGALLAASFTRRQGERHLYYVCRAGKKQQPICPQQPVRADDLGRDPQLEKAVVIVSEELKKNPLPTLRRPKFPNHHPSNQVAASGGSPR